MRFLSLTVRSLTTVSCIAFVSSILSLGQITQIKQLNPIKWIHDAYSEELPTDLPSGVPAELKDIGVSEHLGSQISISDYSFKDESGNLVNFSSYFKKPIVFFFYYNQCKTICPYVAEGVVNSLKGLDWTAGEKFDVVALSLDPKESSELARRKKHAYLRSYGRPSSGDGWHFLTGEETQIRKLASELGLHYKYDATDQQYAHHAVVLVLTSQGKISRYLYGIEYPSKDLRLALLEASQGKIGTVMDRIILFCFRYDPQKRKYSVYLNRLMRAGCGSTVLAFGGYLAVFWRRQRKGA